MGRNPKPTDLQKAHLTNTEKRIRKEKEKEFAGEGSVKPYDHLTTNQRKIFKKIFKHMEDIGQLGLLDETLLNNTAIAIDMLQRINKEINEDEDLMFDPKILKAREMWTKDFLKGVEAFGMSPLARAKLGAIASQKKEASSDPVLKAIGE